MTTTDVLARLRDADPIGPAELARQVPAVVRLDLRDQILAAPRGHGATAQDGGHRTGRRVLVGAAAAATVAVLVVAGGVISRPDHVGGPATASAAEVLRSAGDTARGGPDYVLSGSERIYSGYLGRIVSFDSGPDAGELRLSSDVYSGEWWTDSEGAFLQRTRVYSDPAADKLGIEIGADDWFEQTANPTDGSEQPMTYAQLRAIPTDPAGLTAYLKANVDRSESANPRAASGTVGVATGLLTQPLAPPALRGAVFDLLADLPGVVNLGASKDVYGRSGVLIGYPTGTGEGNSARGTLLIEPATAAALEERGQILDAAQARARYGPGVDVPVEQLGRTRTFVGPTVVAADRTVPTAVSVAPPDGSR